MTETVDGPNCAQVVKLSWPSNLRPPEADLLRRARDHGVDVVAKLLGHRLITSIEELRDELTLPDSHRFRSASCDASISFPESRSQATLSRSFDISQSSETSRSRLEKRSSMHADGFKVS
jgi:hypothetical protein